MTNRTTVLFTPKVNLIRQLEIGQFGNVAGATGIQPDFLIMFGSLGWLGSLVAFGSLFSFGALDSYGSLCCVGSLYASARSMISVLLLVG